MYEQWVQAQLKKGPPKCFFEICMTQIFVFLDGPEWGMGLDPSPGIIYLKN